MHNTCSTGVWLTGFIDISLRSMHEKLADRGGQIVRPHQRLADEDRADAGVSQLENVVARSNAAFADKRRLRYDPWRQPDRVLQIGHKCSQIAIVDPHKG